MNIDSRVIAHVWDYLEKETHYCFDSQEPMIQVIQTMDQTPFVKWAGKQVYFKLAKTRLEGHATVVDLSNPLIFGHKKNQSRILAAAVDFQSFASDFPALHE